MRGNEPVIVQCGACGETDQAPRAWRHRRFTIFRCDSCILSQPVTSGGIDLRLFAVDLKPQAFTEGP